MNQCGDPPLSENCTKISVWLQSFSQTDRHNKKHSENANTSTSLTFDLEMWPWHWPYVKVKKDYVIRCRLFKLLYCTLVPDMMSMGLILYEIWPVPFVFYVTFVLHIWSSASVKVFCTLIFRYILCSWRFVSKMKFGCLVKFEIKTCV